MTGLCKAALYLLIVCFSATTVAQDKYRLVIIPKLVGISYYDAVKQGVDQAARELPQLQVVWAGPAQDRVEKQIELIDKLIPTHPSMLAVAANDPVDIVPALKRARAEGIRVMSWDGDTMLREFFVNLVDFNEFGERIVAATHEEVGERGDIAIITTSFNSPNQASWIAAIKRQIYTKHPGLKIVDVRPAGESAEEAYRIAQDYLKSIPTLKAIIALGSPNLPGAARAVKEAGLSGRVAVVGNSTPNLMRAYLKDGTVKKVVLWNAIDHGYLTVYTAYRLLSGELKAGSAFHAGRLGPRTPVADAVSLQVALPVLEFTKDNVDRYHF